MSGLLDALIEGVRERAQRKDVSRWQKARDMYEFQGYLRAAGRPHSTRDLATLTSGSQSTVALQLSIAEVLTEAELARVGVTPEDLAHLSNSDLLRIAKLPAYLRAAPLKQAARQSDEPAAAIAARVPGPGAPRIREERRAAAYRRMRDEGAFQVEISRPVTELTTKEAHEYLDDFLPAVASVAEVAMGSTKRYFIGLTGNGGILVYLPPQPG